MLLIPMGLVGMGKDDEENDEDFDKNEFWKQQDGLGYKPCLDFSRDYRRLSPTFPPHRTKIG